PAFMSRLYSGDVDAVTEYGKLQEAMAAPGAETDLALAGLLPSQGNVVGSLVADLRSLGVGDAVIREWTDGIDSATGKLFTPEIIAATKARRAQLLANPEFTAAFMRKDAAAIMLRDAWARILASEPTTEL